MSTIKHLMAGMLLALVLSSTVVGQSTPSEFLGYELGSKFTLTQHLEEYYRHLAEESPRVVYQSYGKSVLGRDLPFIIIGSEENLANRGQIKEQVKYLTKRTDPLPQEEVDRLAAETPSILYIYVLDAANEIPGVDGSMQIAYDLATKEDPATRRIRKNLLVIMSPMPNPDAHAKNVEWNAVYDVPGSSVDPNSKQNRVPWGLQSDGNVWGIDINRDFTWFVTPETRAMAQVSAEWQPQTVLDLHCCPPIFFMTPTGPPDHPMWPDENRTWGERSVEIAKKRFGERGFTMSSGMDYAGITYLGHGLTWGLLGPTISGQMFESIGGMPDVRRPDGSVATLEMGIERHIVGTWSVMESLSNNKEELMKDAYNIAVRSARQAREAEVRGAVIPVEGPNVDRDKVNRLLERLDVQGVEIRRATESFTVEGSPFMDTGSDSDHTFSAGTYYVDFVQPYSRLARAILDPTLETPVPQVDPRNPREEPFYDSQVQNLPLLFGVNAYTIEQDMPSIQSEAYDGLPLQYNESASSQNTYGYILPAGIEASYKVAIGLMQDEANYKVRVFKGPFVLNGKTYTKGSFAVINSRNPEGVQERIRQLSEKYQAELVPVATPINDAGVDFGNSDLVEHIPNPRVAVLADNPARFGDIYAGIRTMLEVDFDMTFSSVRRETIEETNLSKYTAVVLPDGRNYQQGLTLDKLRRYVQQGGTVIAAKSAGAALAEDSVLGKNIDVEETAEQTFGTILRGEWVTYDFPTPGSWTPWKPDIKVDRPLLSVGFDKEFAARGAEVILYSVDAESDAEVVANYSAESDKLLLDGFMVEEDKSKIAGRPYVVKHPVGSGNVIYLTEPVNYRGYWYGTNLIFMNSLLFGPTL